MSTFNSLQIQNNELRQRLNKFLETLPIPIEDLADNYLRTSVFIYFLTKLEGEGVATKNSILELFYLADLNKPSNLDRDLKIMKSSQKIIPYDDGFSLHRKESARIQTEINTRQTTINLKKNLSDLSKKIKNCFEKDFIEEAIRCFGTRPPAKRATIILTWVACMDHMQNYLLKNKKILKKFNNKLANSKKKIKKITRKEDFTELDENPFIITMREAKITDKNVHKQLLHNLEFRDSCAHPNELYISESKVESFVEETLSNIILKYKIK